MSAPLDIRFLDSKSLGTTCHAKDIIAAFTAAGFSIEELEIAGRQMPWNVGAEGVQPSLGAADTARGFAFRAWQKDWRLEVWQQVLWSFQTGPNDRRVWVVGSTTNTPYFWDSRYRPASYSQLILDLGKSLYSVLQPTFGWIDFDYGLRTTHEDVETLSLPALYWANFFGPAYVSKIGYDKILRAPARTVEELPDGGLLLILASCPGVASDHVEPAAVAAYFGVDRVR